MEVDLKLTAIAEAYTLVEEQTALSYIYNILIDCRSMVLNS